MKEVFLIVIVVLGISFVALVVRGFVKAERGVNVFWHALVTEYGANYSPDRLARESRGAASGLASIKAGHLAVMARPISAGILVWNPTNQSVVIPWDRIRLMNVRNDVQSEITIEVISEDDFEKVVTLPWKPDFNIAIRANLP
jgi:hypothetical protein